MPHGPVRRRPVWVRLPSPLHDQGALAAGVSSRVITDGMSPVQHLNVGRLRAPPAPLVALSSSGQRSEGGARERPAEGGAREGSERSEGVQEGRGEGGKGAAKATATATAARGGGGGEEATSRAVLSNYSPLDLMACLLCSPSSSARSCRPTSERPGGGVLRNGGHEQGGAAAPWQPPNLAAVVGFRWVVVGGG